MKVLVGFEQSQIVTAAFIARGHDAMSCDLYYDGAKGLPHYRGDVFDVLSDGWDLAILHPPCTYTALCGNRWYWNSPLRLDGVELCTRAWNIARKYCKKVALEQPKTIMQRYIGKRSQTIHPWQFGHGETKETWLWLHNLQELQPTNIVDGRENRIWKMPPSEDRQRKRSETFSGIADAFATQWSF